MHSLKTKLVVVISILIVLLFSLTSFLLINEQQRELTGDIFMTARSFADLTSADLVANYNLYLPQKSFVYFNREVQDTFAKFSDLKALQIVSYTGELLYDSETELDKQYEGEVRMVKDDELLTQVTSKNPSVKTLDTDRVVYLKPDEECDFVCVDENEEIVEPLAADERIEYLVQPATDNSVVIYYISYDNLQSRINSAITRGVLMAVFGVLIGVLMAYFFAGSITKPLKKLTIGAGIIAKGDFKHRVQVKTKDEIATLAGAFNSMAKELEISTKALVYKERVAKELEIAAQIQLDLIPKVIPQVKGLDIAAGLLPAEEIGGDCYDFLKTDDENMLFYLGDVTGHGVPSGLVVSVTNALIYNYGHETNLKKLLTQVNKILKDKTSANMFITLVMLHWNSKLEKLRYVSCGHEQMIHFSMKDKKVNLTPPGGVALGMLPDISSIIKEQSVIMRPGDAIVIYSDGIPEAWKNEKEMYGMARFKRAVSEYSDLPTALAIRNALIADVKEFTAGYKQMDDITIVVIKKPLK